jgi:hypothetical protein
MSAQEVVTKEQLCKAAIAKTMGRDPKVMQVLKIDSGIVSLQYVRKSDGSLWAYRCRVEGSQIIWASDSGRWRDDPRDERITYSIEGGTVTIKETLTSGDTTQVKFKSSQLQ